jgi:hypothetical protein
MLPERLPMTVDELDPLSRLAIRHGSDKFGGHVYTPIYHRLFGHLRDRPIRLLEIGVGGYTFPEAGGASLRMWAEYFPAARIVGLDVHPKRLNISPRITTVQGSQTDHELLRRLVADYGPFDIVVDDGSHQVEHVLSSFRCLYPLLPPGGFYVVEDTQTSFNPDLGGEVSGRGTIYDLADGVTRAMQVAEGFHFAYGDTMGALPYGAITESVAFFRNIIAFTRGNNTYPSNHGLDLANIQAQAIYRCMAEEAARNPGPRDSLSRIDMCIWAGRGDEAGRLALAAANAWPNDLGLLADLARMMSTAGRDDLLGVLRERMTRLTSSAAPS